MSMKSYINIKRFANDVRPVKKTQLSKKKDLWFIWSPLKGRTEEWGHQKRQHAGLELLWADCHDYTYSRHTRLVQGGERHAGKREGQYRVQVYKYKYNMVNGMQANGKGLRGRLYQPGLVSNPLWHRPATISPSSPLISALSKCSSSTATT